MRIIFIIKSLASRHGVERAISDKANYFARLGNQIALLTYEQGSHALAFPIDIAIRHLDIDVKFFVLSKYPLLKRFLLLKKAHRLFKERLCLFVDDFKPDIIVTTTYSCICMGDIMSVKSRVPIVVESHSILNYEMPTNSLRHIIQKFIYLRALKKCNLLIALTKGDATCWKHYFPQVLSIPNPVSFYCNDIEHQKRLSGRIICVGRLQEPKRFDIVIEAFSMIADKYPEWYVDIYGDGDYRNTLEKIILQKGLELRIFLRMSTKDLYAEYVSSQFFVHSSEFEGFGLVLIEAMACGLPVVSTNCPFGPSEIVENGINGFLTELDAYDMASKMEWMISHEKERNEMGKNAHLTAARYKEHVVMKEWEKAYESVLE